MDSIIKNKYNEKMSVQMITTVFMVGLSGLAYLYPFMNNFRLTLSIAVLAIFLLVLEKLPIVLTATLSGVVVVGFRVIFGFVADSTNFYFLQELPALAYYVFYGIGFYLLNMRRMLQRGSFALFISLIVLDIAANLGELFIHEHILMMDNEMFELPILITASFVRTFAILMGYLLLISYQKNVLRQNHWERYCELLMLSAKLRAEWFYLQKSSENIEKVMEKSYILYKDLRQNSLADNDEKHSTVALEIAREIHEVKKDYQRVTRGLEKILKIPPHGGTMRLSEVFFLVEQNTQRYLQQGEKKIELKFKLTDDLDTDRYYTLTAILDNLLINSIEACKNGDSIELKQWVSDGKMIMEVKDTGAGISEEHLPYIFQPGYSTKYSALTGKMSTGIGLSHVNNLVCNLSGSVELINKEAGNTLFRVIVPVEGLLVEHMHA